MRTEDMCRYQRLLSQRFFVSGTMASVRTTVGYASQASSDDGR